MSYTFVYQSLGTAFISPQSKYVTPTYWMVCKGLSSISRFYLHTLVYDDDATIENYYVFTFKLEFRNRAGDHIGANWTKEFTAKKGDHLVPGERLLFINKKISFQGDSHYTKYEVAKLTLKGSSATGNECTVSCSFEILKYGNENS